MTPAKAITGGGGTTGPHTEVVSLACDQTITNYVATSKESENNVADSAATAIKVVIGAEEGVNPSTGLQYIATEKVN